MRSSPLQEDRTTRARIRDAAIAAFGRGGIAATSLRSIAAQAGVAPSHVIHYFGSKDGLRAACDQHIAGLLRAVEDSVVEQGEHLDPIAILRTFEDGEDMLRYLARLFTETDDSANALVDQIVADSLTYIRGLTDTGWITPGSRERDVLLVLFSLGQIALGPHATRWTGVDYVNAGDDPGALAPLIKGYLEFATRPLLTKKGAQILSTAFAGDGPSPPTPSPA